MSGHQYKFQGLITLRPGDGKLAGAAGGRAGGRPWELPRGGRRRMVVRAENHQTHGAHFFNALVANAGDGASWLGDDHALVTVSVAVEEPPDQYFAIGDRFALWLAGNVVNGVVTRRLFI